VGRAGGQNNRHGERRQSPQRTAPQNRWMRWQASSSLALEVA
jgi:hypothetical protein